jgi:hypothetical protein
MCSKAGAYWDSREDLYLAMINFRRIFYGETELYTPAMMELQRSYSWTTMYLTLLPLKIMNIFGFDIDPNGANGITYRNLSVFLIFLIGVGGIAVWLKNINQIPVVYSYLLAMTVPTLVGHSYFNEKDLPAFSGLGVALGALSVIYKNQNNIKNKSLLFTFSFLSTILVGGSRPGLLLLLIPTSALCFWYLVRHRDKNYLLIVILSQTLAFILLWVTNFNFRQDGFFWIMNSLQSGSNFPHWQGKMLLWGRIYSPGVEPDYLTSVLASQIPNWVLFVIITAGLIFLYEIIFKEKKVSTLTKKVINIRYFPFCMVVIIILYSVTMTPVLYNDARQSLFVWTYILAMAVPLVSYVLFKKIRIVNFLVYFLVTLTLADSISLAQYNYMYRNIAAQYVGIEKFETDYWAISGRSLVKKTLKQIPSSEIINYTAGPINSVSNFMPITSNISVVKPFIYFDSANNILVQDQFPGCKVIAKEYVKQMFSKKILVSYAKRCE